MTFPIVLSHGHIRTMQRGDVLIEQGDRNIPFFDVVSSDVEVVRPSDTSETIITVHRQGNFTGEVNKLSGRPAIFRARIAKEGYRY